MVVTGRASDLNSLLMGANQVSLLTRQKTPCQCTVINNVEYKLHDCVQGLIMWSINFMTVYSDK